MAGRLLRQPSYFDCPAWAPVLIPFPDIQYLYLRYCRYRLNRLSAAQKLHLFPQFLLLKALTERNLKMSVQNLE